MAETRASGASVAVVERRLGTADYEERLARGAAVFKGIHRYFRKKRG